MKDKRDLTDKIKGFLFYVNRVFNADGTVGLSKSFPPGFFNYYKWIVLPHTQAEFANCHYRKLSEVAFYMQKRPIQDKLDAADPINQYRASFLRAINPLVREYIKRGGWLLMAVVVICSFFRGIFLAIGKKPGSVPSSHISPKIG